MKSKIIAVLFSTIVFILILVTFFLVKEQKEITVQPVSESEVRSDAGSREVLEGETQEVLEGESCDPKAGKVCQADFSCEEGYCVPKIEFKEIVNPKTDENYYNVAEAGPYKKNYNLHVDRLVVSEKLYVWVGGQNKPHWFKARREKELRPYTIKVPKGNKIRVKLRNTDKVNTPEFRGRIYLTKP